MSAYKVLVSHQNGRMTSVTPDIGNYSIQVATPPEFDQGISGHWSPEHLLAASVGTCYMTTFLAMADKFRIGFQKLEVNSEAILERNELNYSINSIKLQAQVIAENEGDAEKIPLALEKAKKYCLVSNTLKIPVHLNFDVKFPTPTENF